MGIILAPPFWLLGEILSRQKLCWRRAGEKWVKIKKNSRMTHFVGVWECASFERRDLGVLVIPEIPRGHIWQPFTTRKKSKPKVT